jgi:hypothetical protein
MIASRALPERCRGAQPHCTASAISCLEHRWYRRFAISPINVSHRAITPIEQWVYSYLGILPLLSLVLVVVASWSQFLTLFASVAEPPRSNFTFKVRALTWFERAWAWPQLRSNVRNRTQGRKFG